MSSILLDKGNSAVLGSRIYPIYYTSTIRAWASSVDCQPGFLDNVIKSIGECVQMKGWMSDVVLIVDATQMYSSSSMLCDE